MDYYLVLTFDISKPPNNIYLKINAFLNARSFTKYQTNNTYRSAVFDIDQHAEYYYPGSDDYDESEIIKRIVKQETQDFEDFLKTQEVTGQITMFPVLNT